MQWIHPNKRIAYQPWFVDSPVVVCHDDDDDDVFFDQDVGMVERKMR
jgi:hypothetical protein